VRYSMSRSTVCLGALRGRTDACVAGLSTSAYAEGRTPDSRPSCTVVATPSVTSGSDVYSRARSMRPPTKLTVMSAPTHRAGPATVGVHRACACALHDVP
jgi:hypothetical protein